MLSVPRSLDQTESGVAHIQGVRILRVRSVVIRGIPHLFTVYFPSFTCIYIISNPPSR